ncbi:hypothetical protein FEG63_00095 [Mycolicibacterium sphagni]|uniref:Uncharacterized protein n=2 Tax=Mycolicibacterium sphagni TaxID=1786 RepID=A0ABX2JML8_9MYCO|nr:hypothetical protein [Mycolicibacterium sphagni]
MHPEADDPIARAFTDYQRAPRDVVPHTVHHSIDDLRRLADNTIQVMLTHYEMSDDGVTKHTEWATVTRPVTIDREENR